MTKTVKSNWKVVADQSKCTACLMCQLVCSLMKENMFNPSQARVKISKSIMPNGSLDVKVSFTNECDGCGICARYCAYGALSRVRAGQST